MVSSVHIKKYNLSTLVTLFTIFGHHGNLVAIPVPANHLALNLIDSGQLACYHPEHLHLCSPAC